MAWDLELEVLTALSLSIKPRTEPLLFDPSPFSFGTLSYRSGIFVNNTSLNPHSVFTISARDVRGDHNPRNPVIRNNPDSFNPCI
jgi:hypothetical protein